MLSIGTEAEILLLFKQNYSKHLRKYFGFYSSILGKIITEEYLMQIPIDDRIATRAHGVFDVIYAKNLKLINFDSHLDRLFKSAQTVCINPPFSFEETKEVILNVTEQVVNHHIKNFPEMLQTLQHFGVRIVISSGYGDLGISSLDMQSILYITIFEPYISIQVQKTGVHEFVVYRVKQPKKNVHSKTIDYLENSLMANQSKKKGGYQGIKVLENGILLEAAMANIGFIFGKQFATPRFETVIEGTTIKKSLFFLEQLRKRGVIDKISLRDIRIEEAYTADEMIIFGGDKVVPVLSLDGHSFGNQKGIITKQVQQWYQKETEIGLQVKIIK